LARCTHMKISISVLAFVFAALTCFMMMMSQHEIRRRRPDVEQEVSWYATGVAESVESTIPGYHARIELLEEYASACPPPGPWAPDSEEYKGVLAGDILRAEIERNKAQLTKIVSNIHIENSRAPYGFATIQMNFSDEETHLATRVEAFMKKWIPERIRHSHQTACIPALVAVAALPKNKVVGAGLVLSTFTPTEANDAANHVASNAEVKVSEEIATNSNLVGKPSGDLTSFAGKSKVECLTKQVPELEAKLNRCNSKAEGLTKQVAELETKLNRSNSKVQTLTSENAKLVQSNLKSQKPAKSMGRRLLAVGRNRHRLLQRRPQPKKYALKA